MPDRLRSKVRTDATDHDLLIQLIELTKYIADKQTEIRADQDKKLAEIKQNQEVTIAKMDARLVTLETLVVRNNIEQKIPNWNYAYEVIRDFEKDGKIQNWDDAHQWTRDIRKSWKLLIIVVGTIAGAVSWLVQMLPIFKSQ